MHGSLYIRIDTVLEGGEVAMEESDGVGFGHRELEWNFGATLGLAEVPIANGRKPDGVRAGRGDEALEPFDEVDGVGVSWWWANSGGVAEKSCCKEEK